MILNAHHDEIAVELVNIRELSRAELVARWEAHHRRPPPKGISRRLLKYAEAYHAQVKAYGGPSSAVRRQLMRPVPSTRPADKPDKASRRKNRLTPGTRLVREWHGVTHTVEVLKQGFAHDGELYGSLSEIARRITGARWSGPRFFGV